MDTIPTGAATQTDPPVENRQNVLKSAGRPPQQGPPMRTCRGNTIPPAADRHSLPGPEPPSLPRPRALRATLALEGANHGHAMATIVSRLAAAIVARGLFSSARMPTNSSRINPDLAHSPERRGAQRQLARSASRYTPAPPRTAPTRAPSAPVTAPSVTALSRCAESAQRSAATG
jgi:hypothetical protein